MRRQWLTDRAPHLTQVRCVMLHCYFKNPVATSGWDRAGRAPTRREQTRREAGQGPRRTRRRGLRLFRRSRRVARFASVSRRDAWRVKSANWQRPGVRIAVAEEAMALLDTRRTEIRELEGL